MMKQRWGLDRNVLRPTPGDPWGVEQHHWNTWAEENQQLNPGGPSNRQKKLRPKPTKTSPLNFLTTELRDLIYNHCIENCIICPTGRIRVYKIRFVSTGENCRKPSLVCKKGSSKLTFIVWFTIFWHLVCQSHVSPVTKNQGCCVMTKPAYAIWKQRHWSAHHFVPVPERSILPHYLI